MSDKNYSIYKITSPSGKVYIGQSCQVQERIKWYKRCASDQPAIYNSIKKYGYDNHIFEILFNNLTKDEVNQKEIELIKVYKDLDISLNIADGGNLGIQKGIKVYQFTLDGNFIKEYDNIHIAAREIQVDPGSIRNNLYGRSSRVKNFVFSKFPESIKHEPRVKKVYEYDLEGNFVKEWGSIKEVANFYNASENAMYRKTHRNFQKRKETKFKFNLTFIKQ